MWRQDPEHRAERQQSDERPELTGRNDQLANPSAALNTRSSVASAAAISA
jgi:hypothetical protein